MLEFLCAIRMIAAVMGACAPPNPLIVGYVEGEHVRLGPIDAAKIDRLLVRRGERVAAGAMLAIMERDDASIAVSDARARLAQSEADLDNLKRGRRPEEIAVIEASLASAKAQARDAERALERRADLFRRGVSTQAEFDQATTAKDVALARVAEVAANLEVARLPARPAEIIAAENRVVSARAALANAEWRLAQRTILAGAPGQVTDLIRRPGEVAGPAAPVLAFLPDGAVKLIVYVPEPRFSAFRVGARLDVRCAGCPAGLSATVSYVATEPEFTPPVIYSVENRQRLVFLVEARPDGDAAARLAPGQIIDVALRLDQ